MKIPEVIVKEFKRISFALAEDEALFDKLKGQSLEEFWQNIDSIVEQKGIYRTMESDHIAFLLDRLDQLLEESIEVIKLYETGEDYKSDSNINLLGTVSNNSEQNAAYSSTSHNSKSQSQQQKAASNSQKKHSSEMNEELSQVPPFIPVTKEAKEKADAQILKILQIESRLLKKDQYKFLYRQLDRILDILNWTDSLKIKRCALYILLLIVVIEEGSPKQELIYLKQHQLDQMSFFVRYYILHINSFNEGYTELSGLFKFDDERYYKLELQYNPKYKATNILDFEKAQQIQKELEEQYTNFGEQKTSTVGTSDTFTPPEQEFEDIIDQEETLKKLFIDQEEENWVELEKRARHFEFIENSINTKPLNSLSIKPILQKLQGDKLIAFQLQYDDSLTLFQNVKKIYKDNIGKELESQICLFGGIKERLIILKNLKCRESRIEIAKIFLLSIQILSKINQNTILNRIENQTQNHSQFFNQIPSIKSKKYYFPHRIHQNIFFEFCQLISQI